MMAENNPKIIVALDFADLEIARSFVSLFSPKDCLLKVGKELFVKAGPRFIVELISKGFKVFLDLKFHDIPVTVTKACQAAADLGVFMLNVHALGGKRMLEAAANSLANRREKPILLAVTALTSWNDEELQHLGITSNMNDFVLRLATLSHGCGLDGVVCSAKEVFLLQDKFKKDFCFVTPGIRLQEDDASSYLTEDDQRRIVTPIKAMDAGASYLVIGRPITKAKHPRQVLDNINVQIGLNCDS